MTAVSDHFTAGPEPAATPEPKVFARTIAIPPGLPWEQSRAAGLEARHSAPIPMAGVICRLRRLDIWSPGRSGRFVALYVREAEIAGRFRTTVEAEGRRLEFVFESPAEQRLHARRRLTVLAGAGGAAAGAVLIAGVAVNNRMEAEARLSGIEQSALARAHAADQIKSAKDQALALDRAGVRGRTLQAVLNDLAAVSAARAPGAHIQAFHWDRGFTAIEVRGSAPPLGPLGRDVRRADQPVRPGVWLWAVSPRPVKEAAP